MPDGVPFRFTAYDGSSAGPADSTIHLHLETGAACPTCSRRRATWESPAPTSRATSPCRASIRRPVRPDAGCSTRRASACPRRSRRSSWCVASAGAPSSRRPRHQRKRCPAGAGCSRGCGTPRGATRRRSTTTTTCPTGSTSWSSGPSMTYTCAVFPTEDATLEQAQFAKYDLVCRKLGLKPGMRLLDVGSGWGGMVRHAATHYGVEVVGVTLSREQAAWAQDAIKRDGLDDVAEVRFGDYRDVPDTGFDAVSSIGLTEHIGIRNYPSYFAFLQRQARAGRPAAQPLHHPAGQRRHRHRRLHRPLRVPRRRADRLGPDHHRDPERRPGGAPRGEPPGALRADAQGLVREPGGQLGRVRRARSARAPRRCGASTWPVRGCRSSATRSSCTRCSPSSPTRTGMPVSRCAPPGSADHWSNPLPRRFLTAAENQVASRVTFEGFLTITSSRTRPLGGRVHESCVRSRSDTAEATPRPPPTRDPGRRPGGTPVHRAGAQPRAARGGGT